mgnify:CR=1 FL=1
MEKILKYFYPIPMILSIGSVLNPYFKMEQTIEMIKLLHSYIRISEDHINRETIVDLKAKINELYLYYSNVVQSNVPLVAQSSHTKPTGEDDEFNPGRLKFWQQMRSR